jgi:glycosyltransferase involved in cell wall biosynthesis
MKVLHINQSDIGSGAGIAGYRLHQSLLNQGIHSRQLVGTNLSHSEFVDTIPHNRLLEKVLGKVTRPLGLNYLNQQTHTAVMSHEFYREADILNFHNLHNDYFNYCAIDNLTSTKPAIYTLHDMWAFTGHCSYSYDCSRWQTGCGQCPYPNIYPEIQQDHTHLEWRLKNWIYSRSNLTIVTPSRWLMQQAQQSMLRDLPIHHIPYGVDTDIYQPRDRAKCRELLGIEPDQYVLMFGAASLSDKRKGGDLLVQALSNLPASLKPHLLLLMLGQGSAAIADACGIPCLNLGYVDSDSIKAIAFSAADLFLLPTRADNLPLVLQESMACGTPMVSFKIGGVSDLVRPQETGYLATPEDTDDFCHGIIQLLEDSTLRQTMAHNCRMIALGEYQLQQQADRYTALYNAILA